MNCVSLLWFSSVTISSARYTKQHSEEKREEEQEEEDLAAEDLNPDVNSGSFLCWQKLCSWATELAPQTIILITRLKYNLCFIKFISFKCSAILSKFTVVSQHHRVWINFIHAIKVKHIVRFFYEMNCLVPITPSPNMYVLTLFLSTLLLNNLYHFLE